MVEPILESSLGKTARPAAFLSTLAARVRYRAEGKPVVDLPTRTAIEGVAPNPFNPATEIRYALAEPCEALLGIYNVRGQRVATLLQSEQPAGRYVAVWHGTDDGSVGVASGVYFARLEACGEQFTHRLALIR